MNIRLENEFLQVTISSLGAEMQSIMTQTDPMEYLWQGDPEVLDMRSPVLFPIIGRPQNGKYKLGGKYYNMELHGFAKEMEFKLLSQQVSDRVQTRLEAQLVLLEQVEGFLGGEEPVTREGFERYISRTLTRYPTVKAVEWVPRVTAVERFDYEKNHGLEIRDFPNGSLGAVRSKEREIYYPVTFIEPQSGNEAVLGSDWMTRVNRARAA